MLLRLISFNFASIVKGTDCLFSKNAAASSTASSAGIASTIVAAAVIVMTSFASCYTARACERLWLKGASGSHTIVMPNFVLILPRFCIEWYSAIVKVLICFAVGL